MIMIVVSIKGGKVAVEQRNGTHRPETRLKDVRPRRTISITDVVPVRNCGLSELDMSSAIHVHNNTY